MRLETRKVFDLMNFVNILYKDIQDNESTLILRTPSNHNNRTFDTYKYGIQEINQDIEEIILKTHQTNWHFCPNLFWSKSKYVTTNSLSILNTLFIDIDKVYNRQDKTNMIYEVYSLALIGEIFSFWLIKCFI